EITKLTHSEIAYLIPGPGGQTQVSVSSLRSKEPALRSALARPGATSAGAAAAPFELELAGDRYVGIQMPLQAATGETVGSVLALRSMADETKSFRDFRKGAPTGGDRRSGMDRRAMANPATAQTQLGSQATMALDTVPTQAGGETARGAVFANRYEVLGTVGKGGMGVVYRARDQQLDEV